jgi:hypothetical protein
MDFPSLFDKIKSLCYNHPRQFNSPTKALLSREAEGPARRSLDNLRDNTFPQGAKSGSGHLEDERAEKHNREDCPSLRMGQSFYSEGDQ